VTDHLRLAIGPTRYLPHDVAVELDERHPLAHGGFQIDVAVADGLIMDAQPRIGFLHRSSEKLFESRDYRQIMMLANRHDWHSSVHGELVIALAIEEALGLVPPERATKSRILLAEVNRINVALMFVGCAVREPNSVLIRREQLLQWYQGVTGSRIHPMINRIGGLAHPVTAEALQDLSDITEEIDPAGIREAILESTRAVADLASITSSDVLTWGLSGPVAKAAGVDQDLRHTDARYAELRDLLPQVQTSSGGLQDRYLAFIAEIEASLRIVGRLTADLLALGATPINVPLPKVVRVPEETTYFSTEGGLGRTGALLVSTGEKMPWRLKLNTPSFHTMQALPIFLRGVPLNQINEALASIFMVIGDVDR